MCGMFGIRRKNTSYYHPQPNLAERTIKTIRSMITTNIVETHREWDEKLPYIAMALRSAVSSSTGYSPSFLTLGREMRLPCDPEAMVAQEVTPPNVSAWAVMLTRNIREAIETAKSNIALQAKRQKPYYDARHRDLTFKKGDLVLKKAHWLSKKDEGFMAKLAPRWQGPFEVAEVCSPLTMRLKKPGSRAVMEGTYHVQELKPYVSSGNDASDVDETSEPDDSDENVVPLTRVLRPRGKTQAKLNQALLSLGVKKT